MGSPELQPIPKRFHFVWFGQTLPLFAVLAIRSALATQRGAAIQLWHSPNLDRERAQADLPEPEVEWRPLDHGELLQRAQAATAEYGHDALDLGRLMRLVETLDAPAARSNLARLLALYCEGGVYLDTDTITLQDFGELWELGAFCGAEFILWPRERIKLTSPYLWLGGPLLMGVRWLGAKLPRGYRAHRAMTRWYTRSVNNAVLGFRAGHPALRRALGRIEELPESQWSRRFRLGTHLLQELVAEPVADPNDQISVLAPDYFYPLGPVVSQHYFRRVGDPAALGGEILSPRTRVIHWYASVSNLLRYDEARIRAEASSSLFAHLCKPLLRD